MHAYEEGGMHPCGEGAHGNGEGAHTYGDRACMLVRKGAHTSGGRARIYVERAGTLAEGTYGYWEAHTPARRGGAHIYEGRANTPARKGVRTSVGVGHASMLRGYTCLWGRTHTPTRGRHTRSRGACTPMEKVLLGCKGSAQRWRDVHGGWEGVHAKTKACTSCRKRTKGKASICKRKFLLN